MLLLIIPALLCGLGIITFIFTHYESRRYCYIRWQRFIHYEFWPTTLFYIPALIYYIYLCLPYRKLGLLSIVNPGMITDGMYQAPKVKVLKSLAIDPANADRIAVCESLSYKQYSQWLSLIKRFMRQEQLDFPVVIKPQVAQRGSGVYIIKSLKHLQQVLKTMHSPEEDYMVQEYASGSEYGVLYARHPRSAKGQITSIVYKEPVSVSADGRKTLRRLILEHPRACLMYHIYFRWHRKELNKIPAIGKSIRLSPIGTHSLGAVFRDANHLYSEKLRAVLDDISKNYKGFYLGRYDLLAQSEQELGQGMNFKIVELNSVMGEPGHIYVPGNSLWKAYRLLFEHCRLSVSIAAENLALGKQPLSYSEFILTTRRAYRDLL